jgi:xylan 1,4-beta-xylosidase
MSRNASWCVLLVMSLCSMHTQGSEREAALFIKVDGSRRLGDIRPMQDVVNGPLCQRGAVDLTAYYRALGLRNIRLHDVPWTFDNAVDTNYIFPHWDASPEDAKNYDFILSDYYLDAIIPLHVNVIYRLGYSAEFKTAIHHNTPPTSNQRFADIAAHIARHYNEGWADGHNWGIKHWEIWNEPDKNRAWNGTALEYDHLYEVTAAALKSVDPSLKVGGPALGGRLEFMEQFLKYCQLHRVPLDFVSWHIYTQDPSEVSRRAQSVRDMMNKYGFGNAESILDEWNYAPSKGHTLFDDPVATRSYFDATQNGAGAAFDVAVLTQLQDAPVDVATFYTGTTEMWGMFTSSGAPQKPYFAFLAFRQLLDSPNRLAVVRPSDNSIAALAGVSNDGQTVRVLLSNTSMSGRRLRLELDGLVWKGPHRYRVQVLDNQHNLEPLDEGKDASSSSVETEMKAQSVLLLTVEPSSPGGSSARGKD